MKYVSFFAVIVLAAFNLYSVSAQKAEPDTAFSIQYVNASNAADSQLVIQYARLSKYYQNVNIDSSLYWADKIISFALLRNNWNYLQYGLQARKLAEEAQTDMLNSRNAILTDQHVREQQKINILTISSIILFISAVAFFILYLRKGKHSKMSEVEKEDYEERIKDIEDKLHEIHEKNLELRKTYKETQTSYDALQKTNEIKDKLIPMIAHDIRSPLASLQNTLSLTRDNIINPEEFQKLSFALEADVFNLRGMLDNMLLWAREQMLEIKINKVKCDLSETFKDVILMYRNNLVTKNITLHNYMPAHLEVITDKEIVTAVIRNLFSNAVKFTDSGKNIYVSQIFLNDKAYISIKDEGKGIEPETLKKLNNKEHVSTRGTANEKGIGLGLLFCREMLMKLEETFDITSYPGQGTSVTFSVSMNAEKMQEATLSQQKN